ncbi:tyrosine-type recombinase/integrase [Streptomyces sp. NPDC042319]|uniref:tyrosine-type recombinase/integrase n=1 Tax=Streptomyces sp. NPDC042319 TaxID=3154332 RepID=UPI0033C6D0D6
MRSQALLRSRRAGPSPAALSSCRPDRSTGPCSGPCRSARCRKTWDRAIERLGLPDCTPHYLRHTWATVTLTNGVSSHEVSRWLGHRSVKITVDRYGHLTP